MHQIRCKELFIKHLEALTSFPEEGNMLLQRKPKIFSPSGSTAFCVRTASYITMLGNRLGLKGLLKVLRLFSKLSINYKTY